MPLALAVLRSLDVAPPRAGSSASPPLNGAGPRIKSGVTGVVRGDGGGSGWREVRVAGRLLAALGPVRILAGARGGAARGAVRGTVAEREVAVAEREPRAPSPRSSAG